MDEIINVLAKNIELLDITQVILLNATKLLKETDENFFMFDENLKVKIRIIDHLLNDSINLLKKVIGS